MTKRYKVIYDRNVCIGAAACAVTTPEGWEIDKEDGKANLLGGTKTGVEKFEMIIEEKDFKKFQDSAEVCPVSGCIKVVEIEE